MGLLTWNHVCTVGVRAMDQQHGVLMDTLNDLRQAVTQGAGRDRVEKEMNRLLEFTGMHFASEERLLEQHGFPAVAEHRAAHARLLDHMREAVQHAAHAPDAEIHSLVAVLRNGFMEHVEAMDQAYGEWLNERGVV